MFRKLRIAWIQLSMCGSIAVLQVKNMCKKSSHKHILELAQKNTTLHKFEFFETCWAGLCPVSQSPLKAS
jgi:hypothetical protein